VSDRLADELISLRCTPISTSRHRNRIIARCAGRWRCKVLRRMGRAIARSSRVIAKPIIGIHSWVDGFSQKKAREERAFFALPILRIPRGFPCSDAFSRSADLRFSRALADLRATSCWRRSWARGRAQTHSLSRYGCPITFALSLRKAPSMRLSCRPIARIREQEAPAGGIFADRAFTLLLVSQIVLLAAALMFTPTVSVLLAPGFVGDPGRLTLRSNSPGSRFPIFCCWCGGDALGGISMRSAALPTRRCGAHSAQPLDHGGARTGLVLPTPVTRLPGACSLRAVLKSSCLRTDASRQGALPKLRWPRLDQEMKLFLKRFAPATVGSAEPRLRCLPTRINCKFSQCRRDSAALLCGPHQSLPIGVIGVAVGTVLLPEMSRRIAGGR